jgi:hypothetical protein
MIGAVVYVCMQLLTALFESVYLSIYGMLGWTGSQP